MRKFLWCKPQIRMVWCSCEQALKGPWGSGRSKLRIFVTFDTMKVVRPTPRQQPSLPPGVSWYSFLGAESTPGHVVSSVATEKSPATPQRIDPKTLQLVAQRLNHYATPGPLNVTHKRNKCRVFVAKSEDRRPFGRHCHR